MLQSFLTYNNWTNISSTGKQHDHNSNQQDIFFSDSIELEQFKFMTKDMV